MLDVRRIDAGYGRAQILFDLSLNVQAGEVVALLGRNGAGKSTTLKTIAGLLQPMRGEIDFAGQRIDGVAAYQIARMGLGWVPENRRIFADLTVAENLEVGRQRAHASGTPWTVERLHRLFPSLAELGNRLGGHISGGEQQMLAIARTLMGNPRLMLLDEPSEGLAPVIVDNMVQALQELKREGVALLLAEQSLTVAREIADRAYVIESGRIRLAGTYEAFARDSAARAQYLGLE